MSDVTRRAFGFSILSGAAAGRGGGPPRLFSYSPVAASQTPAVLIISGIRFDPEMRPSVSVSTPGMIAEAGVLTEITSTRCVWTVPLPTQGTIYLRVTNPDGKTSNALSIVVSAGTIVDPPPPPPPPSGIIYGPRADIVPPDGAIVFAVGSTSSERQATIDRGW